MLCLALKVELQRDAVDYNLCHFVQVFTATSRLMENIWSLMLWLPQFRLDHNKRPTVLWKYLLTL
jgi:hypothetical protein